MSLEKKPLSSYCLRFFLLCLLILLVGCSTPTPTVLTSTSLGTNTPTSTFTLRPPTVSPTFTLASTATRTPIQVGPTLTPTRTLLPTFDLNSFRATLAAPTPTPEPSRTPYIETYPLKQVWVIFEHSYNGIGVGGAFDFDDHFNSPIPDFVIYTDYTMILDREGDLLEKKLSDEEMCSLFSSLNWLGLEQITTDGISEDDPIYLSGAKDKLGGDRPRLLFQINGDNSKFLSINQDVLDFVIQPIKNILNFLGQYSPKSMQLYHPDRLAVFVYPAKDPNNPGAIPWPTDAPSLAEHLNSGFYLEGATAAEVYELIRYNYQNFTEQGIEYNVWIQPLLPHQERGYHTDHLYATSVPSLNCP